MRGAFTLSRSEELRGKAILLIDDVYTTGSTVQECARVLKREGGVGEVFVGTLARTRHG
jgi:predicted amidophosphoribosyltransferase